MNNGAVGSVVVDIVVFKSVGIVVADELVASDEELIELVDELISVVDVTFVDRSVLTLGLLVLSVTLIEDVPCDDDKIGDLVIVLLVGNTEED